jgi:hypothetical protein
MKKYIYLIIITLFVVSCENEIPFDIKNNPPKLVINALFDAGKEKNEIILALTGREKVTYINEAVIDIYINGELKEHLTEPDPVYDPMQYQGEGPINRTYKTKIRFAPGDVVKIEAKTNDGKYRAWSEVTVPQPINIEKVDTTIVTKNAARHSSSKYLRVKTTFTDNGKQANYYRIAMLFDLEIEAKSPITSKDTVINRTVTNTLIVNEDVVLTDGRPSTEDDDNGLLTPVRNNYGVFDNSRISGTYTMITSMMIPYFHFDYPDYYQSSDRYEDIKRIKVKAKVRLLSISKMQYFYLKALNTYDSEDYDDYFNLPVKFPSNIEGGTGIFGISIGNEAIVPLDDYIPRMSDF